MSFVSWQFPFFLIGFVLLYWRVAHRPRLWLLLAGSYVFYAFWDVRFLALVFTTTVVDYLGALGLAGIKSRLRVLLPLALAPFGWLLACYWLVPGAGIDLALLVTVLAASVIFLAITRPSGGWARPSPRLFALEHRLLPDGPGVF